jgi:hypothetical protein
MYENGTGKFQQRAKTEDKLFSSEFAARLLEEHYLLENVVTGNES